MARETKTEQLQVRVSPQQKVAIRQAAENAGMDMSSWVLARALPQPQREFLRLVDQLGQQAEKPSYGLAEINDWLEALGSHEFQTAVADPPARKLSAYLANYLAAMVEVAAQRKHSRAPGWTREIQPLDQPVFGAQLISLRLLLLVNSPPPFRRRNIFIDATVGDRV